MTGLSVAEHSFDLVEIEKFVGESFLDTLVGLQIAQANKIEKEKAENTKTQISLPMTKEGKFFSGVMNRKPSANNRSTASSKNIKVAPNSKKPSDFSYAVANDGKKKTKNVVTTHVALGQVNKPKTSVVDLSQQISTDEEVRKVTDRSLPIVLQQLRTIDEFARMVTPLADGLAVSKNILSPKQFDRIFNVIIDPDDFEIDYNETISTPQGQEALNQLIALGDVIQASNNDITNQRTSNVKEIDVANRSTQENIFMFRDRDKTFGDAVFEKYFVVIETVGL
jgi:hypothetical protein